MDRLAAAAAISPGTTEEIAATVRELADQQAIRNLSAVYSMAVDGHDLATTLACFTEHGAFERAGVTTAGQDALHSFFTTMMSRYSTTLHTPEMHVITVEQGDPRTASGVATGHAELVLEGTLMLAAYRYDDEYAVEAGRWRFSRRRLRYTYVLPFESMATGFGDTRRIRWPQTPFQEADLPESLPTWSDHLA
ncbi:MAG: nuclear transport factor 2 family protein [Frankiales bacterium]|nr:nuclear transport factor 2 family protein [Frankiales bacterium]